MAHEVANVVSIKSVTRSICSIYRLKMCVFLFTMDFNTQTSIQA